MPDDGRREDEPGWAAPDRPPIPPPETQAERPGPAFPDEPPPPPAAPPPPPGWGSPPPARTPPPAWTPPGGPGRPLGAQPRRRRPWIWLLTGAMALIVALAVATSVLFAVKVKPPLDAANAYVGDLVNGRYGAAFNRLCERTRADSSPADLGDNADVSRASEFVRDFEANPFTVDVHGNRAEVEVDLRRQNENAIHFTVSLEREAGEWHPCGDNFGITRT